MEAKLKEYRALRRRKELIENSKQKLQDTKQKLADFLIPSFLKNMNKDKADDEVLLMDEEPVPVKTKTILIQPEEPSDVTSETSEHESIVEANQESWTYFTVKWTLYAVIWISLFMYFVMVQFGAVFFTFSVLIGIYLNTRTRPKKQGEVSAYSVFNQDCQSINGTLDAEQLQRQMLYGVAGIR